MAENAGGLSPKGPKTGADPLTDGIQAATASSGFLRARQCRHGTMLYLKHDIYVGRALELYGEFSELEWRVLAQMAHPGDVVVEAGANLGTHTVALAQKVGAKGMVHAFEPQRVVHQVMCANVVVNGLTNVHAHHAAVGDGPGTIEVPPVDYGSRNNFGGLSLDGVSNATINAHAKSESVPVVAIDSLNLERLKLLKIDVEGMERAVLLGAKRTIERCRPILYFEADREERNHDLITTAFEMGYRLWWHIPPLFNPDNFDRNPTNVFGRLVSINMIGLHRDSTGSIKGFREVTSPDELSPFKRA